MNWRALPLLLLAGELKVWVETSGVPILDLLQELEDLSWSHCPWPWCVGIALQTLRTWCKPTIRTCCLAFYWCWGVNKWNFLLFSDWEHPQRCGSCSWPPVGVLEHPAGAWEGTGVSLMSHSLLEMSPSKGWLPACPQPFVSSNDVRSHVGWQCWCQQWQSSLLWAAWLGTLRNNGIVLCLEEHKLVFQQGIVTWVLLEQPGPGESVPAHGTSWAGRSFPTQTLLGPSDSMAVNWGAESFHDLLFGKADAFLNEFTLSVLSICWV